MREKPILFSGEMVRAILEGRKTMTRRVLSPQPPFCDEPIVPEGADYATDGCGVLIKLPYQVGDRLWVRETLELQDLDEEPPLYGWCYMADGVEVGACPAGCKGLPFMEAPFTKIPSIFMPRWASRITLEVTAVKVQMVQEIGPLDAADEGVGLWNPDDYPNGYEEYPSRVAFRELWDSINAQRGFGWDVNPWVEAVTFEVVPGGNQ